MGCPGFMFAYYDASGRFSQVCWCSNCGAISTKQTKLLLAPCKGFATKWGKYVRGPLESGYLPKVATMEDRVWVGMSRSVHPGSEATHRGWIDWLPV